MREPATARRMDEQSDTIVRCEVDLKVRALLPPLPRLQRSMLSDDGEHRPTPAGVGEQLSTFMADGGQGERALAEGERSFLRGGERDVVGTLLSLPASRGV